MRVVIQRVKEASVSVDKQVVGAIKNGFLLLVGFSDEDSLKDLDYSADKVLNLRVFEDDKGKMNHSLVDIKGEILSVSQFTLFGDVRKGRRPSFIDAARPEKAKKLYDIFNEKLANSGLKVATGKFGGDMSVSLINEGPVTILIDSTKKF